MIRPNYDIPEHIQGEPENLMPSTPGVMAQIVRQLVAVLIVSTLSAPLWLPYWILRLVFGRAPVVFSFSQLVRYLTRTWTDEPPPPGLSLPVRLRTTLIILRKLFLVPFWGLAWYIDELIYGRQIRAVKVERPLFELSAARSGSTQMAHYLEDDPHIATPMMLQAFFPFLWLWKIAPYTIGKIFTVEKVRHMYEVSTPPAFLQRHEADPFRTDTFEITFFITHLNHLSLHMGPDILSEDFHWGRATPGNESLWHEEFVHYLDGVARKTLLYSGPGPDGKPKTLMIKGHFLAAADALEKKYPDACFMTVIREPAKRIQSVINYLRVGPTDGLVGPVPWNWLVPAFLKIEQEYCEAEMKFYRRKGGARRCVVLFKDYVKDLEGTMHKIYRECLGQEELPPHVSTTHAERSRTNYLVDRSLEQLSIDVGALNQATEKYIRWCKGQLPESEA